MKSYEELVIEERLRSEIVITDGVDYEQWSVVKQIGSEEGRQRN